MGPAWAPPGADRTQVGPMLYHTLLSGLLYPWGVFALKTVYCNDHKYGMYVLWQSGVCRRVPSPKIHSSGSTYTGPLETPMWWYRISTRSLQMSLWVDFSKSMWVKFRCKVVPGSDWDIQRRKYTCNNQVTVKGSLSLKTSPLIT